MNVEIAEENLLAARPFCGNLLRDAPVGEALRSEVLPVERLPVQMLLRGPLRREPSDHRRRWEPRPLHDARATGRAAALDDVGRATEHREHRRRHQRDAPPSAT